MEIVYPEGDQFESAVEFVMLPVTIEVMRNSVKRLTSLIPKTSVLSVERSCVRTKWFPKWIRDVTKTVYKIDGQAVFETTTDTTTFCGISMKDTSGFSGPNPGVMEQVERLGLMAKANEQWEAVKLRMEQSAW